LYCNIQMNKRNIIIIIVITAILVIILITALKTKPDIENIYLSSDKNSNIEELKPEQNNGFYFNSPHTDIYLIMTVKYLTTEDEIHVQWEKKENSSGRIIQENIISPEKKGSGKIIVSLVKKDNVYSSGNYTVTVFLNNDKKTAENFYISN